MIIFTQLLIVFVYNYSFILGLVDNYPIIFKTQLSTCVSKFYFK